jgi:hypothetical protein
VNLSYIIVGSLKRDGSLTVLCVCVGSNVSVHVKHFCFLWGGVGGYNLWLSFAREENVLKNDLLEIDM